MKLLEALEIVRQPIPHDAPAFNAFLACGFTPLELQTYLTAHLRQRLPARAINIGTGLFDDLAGSLENLDPAAWHGVAVVIEWASLDARLGYRALGGWQPSVLPDIAAVVRARLARIERAFERFTAPVACLLPTLAPAPASFVAPQLASAFECELNSAAADFASRIAARPNVRVVNPGEVDRLSPASARLDLRMDLQAGSPYKQAHASVLGGLLATALAPAAPKKGLITDADDTLWAGILGEAGPGGVAWDLEHHAQIHGLYQQCLASLAAAGVLVGIASKNDPGLMDQVLGRADLALKRDAIFPVEAHWQPKSSSVSRILQAWNIGASDVVFVDDSPMELAEVEAAHRGIECLRFAKEDPNAVLDLLRTLRSRFGKSAIAEEDRLRAASLRNASVAAGGEAATDLDAFLASAAATITFDNTCPPAEARAFELVNKTNQFNLNGRRFTEAEWSGRWNEPGVFLSVVSYQDKFGPLGRIAVVSGFARGGRADVDVWVMSCRAFSRRIEHRTLAYLFERLGVDEIALDYAATERNGPVADFLGGFVSLDSGPVRITRAAFEKACPPLHHEIASKGEACLTSTQS